MSTFLELCRLAQQESGTVSPSSLIQNVVGATNRDAKFVAWVRSAWADIQNRRLDWKFRLREFSDLPLVIDQGRYVAASDFNLGDLSAWLPNTPYDRHYSVRDPDLSIEDTTDLSEIDYMDWRRSYERSNVRTRPCDFAISPAGEICFGPIPDKGYLLSGIYRRAPQLLAANLDLPICPTDFHDVIVWRAVLMANGHDEATQAALAHAQSNFALRYSELITDQTPRFHKCASIA